MRRRRPDRNIRGDLVQLFEGGGVNGVREMRRVIRKCRRPAPSRRILAPLMMTPPCLTRVFYATDPSKVNENFPRRRPEMTKL
jgi:hypothetical protein